ncbi:multiple inositol polyphosphate phosphatase 1-like isoform X3 [Varroa jacobsoni]|uniref:multiple inositol polyphosphate phosphatase 1-like isoform X3 n=2 Tax=Varroa jacobsoni TaxID=62625 RepID=UPI000BF6AB40|nr:multiple inositol polyphosphate phosphatase 1-like isoform X3 [Varroa jacobsoni]
MSTELNLARRTIGVSYRNVEGVMHVNPDLFLDDKSSKRRTSNMKVCIRCCCALSVIKLLLIGGTLLYLYLREHHLGCYTPANGKVCYSEIAEKDRYKWFGTKTDYNVTVQLAKDEFEKPPAVGPGCEPVLFYLFQRHTTRYPDREAIEEASVTLQRLAEEITSQEKSRLCKQDLHDLSKWLFPFVPDQDNMVAPEGILVTEAQVKRLSNRFPSVFAEQRPFRDSPIQVDFTSRARSRSTAYAFMTQWYTKEVFNSIIEPQIRNNVNDPLLQFHNECRDLLKRRGKYVKTPSQVSQLEASTYYSSLLETLSSRLGRKVTKGEIKLMFSQCRYEVAIIGKSPWCAVFTTEDLKLLEFQEDLDDFYKDAYGNHRNWQQACPIAQDLFDYIIEAEAPSYPEHNPRTVLHFSHAGAFKKVLSYFGVARDNNTGDAQPAMTWDSVCAKRSWLSSQLCPFNANILFVMYSCPASEGDSAEQQYKMATFVNERLVQLPACSTEFCPLREFRKAFQTTPSSCNISQICS